MTTIFLFFSIIINLFAILAIVILYLRQNRLFNIEKKQAQSMSEMEELFSAYIAEMKEENEDFIKKIECIKRDQIIESDVSVMKTKDKIGTKSIKQTESDSNEPNATTDVNYKRYIATKSYQNVLETNDTKDINEKAEMVTEEKIADKKPNVQTLSFEDQVIFLHEQGLTIDEIAKNLKKGKTEIELLIKFRKKQ